jgi:hypothetical protein
MNLIACSGDVYAKTSKGLQRFPARRFRRERVLGSRTVTKLRSRPRDNSAPSSESEKSFYPIVVSKRFGKVTSFRRDDSTRRCCWGHWESRGNIKSFATARSVRPWLLFESATIEADRTESSWIVPCDASRNLRRNGLPFSVAQQVLS